MNPGWKKTLGVLAAVAFAFGPALARRGATYDVTDLGTLGGDVSESTAINAVGEIVGGAQDASGAYHAFLYSGGQMTDLGLTGTSSNATAINASSTTAGYYYNGEYEGFILSDGHVTDLGNLGEHYSVAYAMNASGQACGSSMTAAGDEHAFLWSGGIMTDINAFGGDYSSARGINASGQVVGFSYLSNGGFHAFVRTGSFTTDLGTLGGDYSSADAINDAGQVVGDAYLNGNVKAHAFLWSGSGALKDLGELGANYSTALALNSTGSQIVGRAAVPNNTGYVVYHAFLYSSGKMQDLNKMTPKGTGWTLGEASGINDAGRIVGTGTIHGKTHAFLLTPR
jgi:probable HAF family extracellular repeat protein